MVNFLYKEEKSEMEIFIKEYSSYLVTSLMKEMEEYVKKIGAAKSEKLKNDLKVVIFEFESFRALSW
jgi:hypothetical protein